MQQLHAGGGEQRFEAEHGGVLPLDPAPASVALIGPAAAELRFGGGGSAQVFPERVVSPLEGLREALGAGTELRHAPGADPRTFLPPAAFPGRAQLLGADGEPLGTAATADGSVHWLGTLPGGVDFAALRQVRLTCVLPEHTGLAGFGLVSFQLGHGAPGPGPDELIEEAVAAARAAEVAVVVVGTTEEVESEGVDRDSLALPGRQDELVARVAAANPRTVVVVNAGAPVLMPWRGQVAAVLLAWFPGQQGGAALADVLLGVVEPGGRLPTTWPAEEADCPVWEVAPTEGRLAYREGLFIGYRAWQRRSGAQPAYWFGAGLGYTQWAYEGLEVRLGGPLGGPEDTLAEVCVRVRNTGRRAGREVVQVYLAPDGVDRSRPDRQLAGFAVVEAGPGEVAAARLQLSVRTVQTWDETLGGWVTRPGTCTVEAGRSVADRPLTVALEVPARS
ncbi:hypothetical protein GCM10023235_26080 [Kitasatospora terrestris]|uniref:Fibronectin type III-like domain-containing protein n=1 Tax=Kitasatospora terrestris TaxID=258051 RepID=A0ABP9DJ11_9ACTN